MDWTDFQNVASDLLRPSNAWTASTEARLRSAIRRSYYAAYLTARDGVSTLGKLTPHQLRKHNEVIRVFRQHPEKQWGEIGANLDRMSALRQAADYDDVA